MSEIKPAMTPEEWARLKEHDWYYHDCGVFIRGEALSEHGAAAALLHGEPFGFTREDVRALRLHVAYWGNPDTAVPPLDPRVRDSIRRQADLADRIEALLPPESE